MEKMILALSHHYDLIEDCFFDQVIKHAQCEGLLNVDGSVIKITHADRASHLIDFFRVSFTSFDIGNDL
jgi:hypothetical protein